MSCVGNINAQGTCEFCGEPMCRQCGKFHVGSGLCTSCERNNLIPSIPGKTLIEEVQAMSHPGEKVTMLTTFAVLRMFPDGSAILYKSLPTGIKFLPLERPDLEALKAVMLPLRQFVPGPEEEKDVHTEHCCVIHGCKYRDEDCPVETGKKKQSYACEDCRIEAGVW